LPRTALQNSNVVEYVQRSFPPIAPLVVIQ
jgi:hypothetical protein